MLEADPDWIETLRYTFGPYKNKVEIIEEYLGSVSPEEITIDEIIGDKKLML